MSRLKKGSTFEEISQAIRGHIVGSDNYYGTTTAEFFRQSAIADSSRIAHMGHLSVDSVKTQAGSGRAGEGGRPRIGPSAQP